jgi:hypothetical protein
MAETKPSNTAVWSTNGGTTLEPSSGIKAAGWLQNKRMPARWLNWWKNTIHKWVLWFNERFFDGVANGDFRVQGVDGAAGTNVDGGDLELSGGSSTGSGSSKTSLMAATAGGSGTTVRTPEAYLVADGNSNQLTSTKTLGIAKNESGSCIVANTNTGSNSNAIVGNATFGTGSGAGGGLGIGVVGVGASGGNGGDGVVGLGNLEGSGVRGEAGSTAGTAGVTGLGSVAGGAGVLGLGAGNYPGVDGLGGGTNGPGVRGTGGASNGIGVLGLGNGTGPGVRGDAEFGSNGSGVVGVGEGSGHGGDFTANSTGYGVRATGAGTKAAYHATPQNGFPTGAEGDFFVHDGVGKLAAHDGSQWEMVARKRLAAITDSSALTATSATAFSNASYTIPAGTLLQGHIIRMRGWGTITDDGATWFQISVMLNGSAVFGARCLPLADGIFFFDAELVVRQIGASGVIAGGISLTLQDPSDSIGGEASASSGVVDPINTSNSITLALGGHFASVDNEMVLQGAVFEIA